MAVLLGFSGAVAALTLFGAGAYAGWRFHAAVRCAHVTADALPEPERQRLREEQAAFQKLQNYTVEDAYGLSGYDNERM